MTGWIIFEGYRRGVPVGAPLLFLRGMAKGEELQERIYREAFLQRQAENNLKKETARSKKLKNSKIDLNFRRTFPYLA